MIETNRIRVVFLDFGGVISTEGFQLGILKLSKIYDKSYDEMYEIVGRKALFESGYIKGKGTEKEFWKMIAKELNIDKNLMDCRNLILDNLAPRKEMVDTVIELKDKFKWGIFSDQTNWIYEVDEKYDFLKYFDYKFISYDLGYTKYDDEFYRIPYKEIEIPAGDILIVDDKQRVLDKAKEFGYKTYRFDSVSGFVDFMNSV